MRMMQVLGGVGSEETHGRFLRRDVEALPVRPRRDLRQIAIQAGVDLGEVRSVAGLDDGEIVCIADG